MTTTFWTMEIPVLSTGHITQQTNEVLTRVGDSNPWMYCASYYQGYFFSVPTDDEVPAHAAGDAVPADLVDIWKWARSKQYSWVRVDVDGDIIDGLPTYEW